MNYWLYVTNSDNWKVTKETNILGASERHRNTFSRISVGDKCLIYVKSDRKNGEITPSKVVAEYEVTSKVFEDNTKIFHALNKASPETFSLRVKLEPIRILETPVAFKSLVSKLDFIKNKERWSLNLKGRAMVEISKKDYNLIVSAGEYLTQ